MMGLGFRSVAVGADAAAAVEPTATVLVAEEGRHRSSWTRIRRLATVFGHQQSPAGPVGAVLECRQAPAQRRHSFPVESTSGCVSDGKVRFGAYRYCETAGFHHGAVQGGMCCCLVLVVQGW